VSVFAGSDVLIKRRRSSLAWAAVGIPLLLLAVCLVIPAAEDFLPHVGMLVMVEAVLFLLSPSIVSDDVLDGLQRVALRADEGGVAIGARRVLERAAIACAAIERRADGSSRVLLLDEGMRTKLEVRLTEAAHVRSLLAALGLGADRSTASFAVEGGPLASRGQRWRSRGVRWAGGVVLAAATFGAMDRYRNDALIVAFPPLLVTYLAIAHRLRRRARVVIGADGVAVRVRRRVRLVPYADLGDVRPVALGAELVLTSGAIVPLYVEGGADAPAARRALCDRVAEARRAYAGGGGEDALAAVLARGDRTRDEWLRALEAMRVESTTYRVGAMPEERLWGVVEDAGAAASARIGAAMVLSRSMGSDGRARLRIVAESTARPSVRRVLAAAARGDDVVAVIDEAAATREDREA
jgi:hypothetical protein